MRKSVLFLILAIGVILGFIFATLLIATEN